MEPLQNAVEQNRLSVDQPPQKPRTAVAKASYAARLFGYDIFISFALGPPPRGTHSYTSDLARRLRELDYTVFFSEDEAPVGSQLDSTLRKALRNSHALVVVANRGMLEDPRWIRTEVEEFHKVHPRRPIIPIFIEGLLHDKPFMETIQEWLPYEGSIWIEEVSSAIGSGIASDAVVNRLVTAPRSRKANSRWSWLARGVIATLLALVVGLGIATRVAMEKQREAEKATQAAINSKHRAEVAQRKETGLRLNTEAQAMLSGSRAGGARLGLLQLLVLTCINIR